MAFQWVPPQVSQPLKSATPADHRADHPLTHRLTALHHLHDLASHAIDRLDFKRRVSLITVSTTKSILLPTTLLAACPALTSTAGTIRADVDDSAYTNLGAESAYSAVGKVTSSGGSASGTYLGNGWVLTAAHVAETAGNTGFTFSVGGDSYQSLNVYTPDRWDSNRLEAGYDIALIQLENDVTGVDPAQLLSNTSFSLLDQTITMVGFGTTGTGETGYTSGTYGTKRAGQNTVDSFGQSAQFRGYDDSIFFVDFDDPDATTSPGNGLMGPGSGPNFDSNTSTALDLEYLIAPGDSGGGAFVEIDGISYLAGVTSFLLATDGNIDASYGDYGGFTYVPAYLDWINTYISIPEPSTTIVMLGLAVINIQRRQQRRNI